jgi:hypothetical protein
MDGDMQSPHSMPMSRPGPGVPLAGSLRGNAELRFGHDFSHVRLHTGSEAAAITAPVGAAALTTGSHVYMNPEVPLSSPKGRHVFDHELTHVLQQAGSRPLGGDYNANPSFGRAGGGIRHDNVQEAAAERVARSVGGRDGGAPIDPGPARTAAGYQPAALGLTTVRRALRKLTDIESAKEGQHEIDRRAGLKTELDADQILIGRRIWDGVRNMIPAAELPKSDPNLDSVRAEFVEYFKGLKSNIDDVVPQIAFGVSEMAKKKDAGDQETATRVVKPKKFARALEDYLLARSGLLVNITLDDADVKSVEVKTLLLAMVGAGKLWEKAMSRVPGDKVAELRPLLREKLRTLNTKTTFLETPPDGSFPSMVSVWEKGEFVFNAKLIGLVLNLAELNRTKGRPTDLPKFKDYINYRDQYSPKIGIRIGKYGDANQSGPDRESHHTTQFLLIEYFRNKSGDKPFPPELRSTLKAAGVVFEGAGNQTKHLEVPGKPDIDFKALDTGDRGEAMPAILISRPTHRGAALHVSGAEADDFPTGGIPVTQGGKVHSTFNNKLVEAGASGIANAGPDQLYRAIQDTYGWMHRYMMAALFKGLRENELIYYGEIVAGPHTKDGHLDPDYVTWPDQMAPVFNAAQDNNDKVMSEKGWVA